MRDEARKTEDLILFPEEQVGRFTVRPWTLAQTVELAPSISGLISVVKEAGAVDAILKSLKTSASPSTAVDEVAAQLLSVLPEIIPKALPYLPKLFAVSVNDTEEAVGRLDLGTSTQLLLTIVTQNVEYLKNFFGPGLKKMAVAG